MECTLVHAQNALMVQSRQDIGGQSHAHGWGVATYEDHRPRVEREAWAAYHGEHFRRAAERIYSRCVLAHVRRATVGPAAIENTHPFAHDRFAFAHNGTIPDFDAVRPRLLDAMAPAHRAAIRGVTDSEHIFRFLLSLHESDPARPLIDTLHAGLMQIVAWSGPTARDEAFGLNMLLADGDRLAGSRLGRTLHYIERDGVYDCEICGFPHIRHEAGRNYRAVVVASEPITHEAWKRMPDRSIFQVTPEPGMEIRPM